ncbi:hypothetical protein [Streptomyces sp. NPDC019507]|uniref:hypothetical protein n=1 Tax=Streptomyces sp. NPDC019507 TaxID=3154689 RepID=UPI0033F33408
MELLWRAQRRNTLVTWPDAVNERLDQLVAAGLAAGENANRSHLLAALVVHADLSPAFVAEVLRTYRSLSTDALDEGNRSAAEQWPEIRRTGPRRDAHRPAVRGDGQSAGNDEDSVIANDMPPGPDTPTAKAHP